MGSASISFAKATKTTSIKHNNRNLTEAEMKNDYHKHIDHERSSENKYIIQKEIKEMYQETFGEAVAEYNQKQKRKDRQIKNYYSKVLKDKKLEPQREFIIQVGKKEDFDSGKIKNLREISNKVLEKYVADFQERNPNLKIYNAAIHNDEATPHLHLNVIPVASGYQRGIQVQPSFDKALRQQNELSSSQSSFDLFDNFRNQEVSVIESLLKEYAIEREFVGTNNIRDHHEYKELKSELKKLNDSKNEIEKTISKADGKTVEFEPVKQKKGLFGREKISENEVIISKDDLTRLQADSKALPVVKKERDKANEKVNKLTESVDFWIERFETTKNEIKKLTKKKDFAEKIVSFASEFVKENFGIKLSDVWKEERKKEKNKEFKKGKEIKPEVNQEKRSGPSL